MLELLPVLNAKNELDLVLCTTERESMLSDMA